MSDRSTHEVLGRTEKEREAAPGGTELGRLVRGRRLAKRMTQQALADRVGCTKGYLSAIETGRKGSPSEEVLRGLESALSIEPGALFAAAAWAKAPEPVRAQLASVRGQGAILRRLAELGSLGGGLDEAHRNGELRRLVESVEALGSKPGLSGVMGAMGTRGGLGDGLAPAALPLEVPLINLVSAGGLAGYTDLGYPAGGADEYVRCPDIGDPDAFAARVVGDSMEPAYREGDIVVFSPQREVRDGDDCFARLEPDDESTFKRVYFEPAGAEAHTAIRLQPVNSRYAPRLVPRERVVGLYRAVTVVRSL